MDSLALGCRIMHHHIVLYYTKGISLQNLTVHYAIVHFILMLSSFLELLRATEHDWDLFPQVCEPWYAGPISDQLAHVLSAHISSQERWSISTVCPAASNCWKWGRRRTFGSLSCVTNQFFMILTEEICILCFVLSSKTVPTNGLGNEDWWSSFSHILQFCVLSQPQHA